MTSTDMPNPTSYRRRVFEWAREMGLVSVRIGIYQPRAAGATEDVIPLDEFEQFAADLLEDVDRVRDADREYRVIPIEAWNRLYLNPDPGNEACDFCRAMATCPAVRAKLQEAADIDFDAVPDDLAEALSPEAVAAKSVEQLDRLMLAVPLFEALVKTVRAEMERRLFSGGHSEHFGLELGRQGNREWKDEETVEELLRRQWRLTIDDVYNFKLKSPTQIEAMTKPTRDPAGAPVAPRVGETRWGRLQDHITRAEPKPSVKPKALIKNPYTPKPAADDFDAVVES